MNCNAMIRYTMLLPLLVAVSSLHAQLKPPRIHAASAHKTQLQPVSSIGPGIASAARLFSGVGLDNGRRLLLPEGPYRVTMRADQGHPIWLEWLLPYQAGEDPFSYGQGVLYGLRNAMQQDDGMNWERTSATQEPDGSWHLRYTQTYRKIPVDGAEVLVHAVPGRTTLVNGRYSAGPADVATEPIVFKEAAETIAGRAVATTAASVAQQAWMPELHAPTLVIFRQEEVQLLAWKVEIMADDLQRWTVYVDAQDGKVLHRRSETCSFRADHLHGDGDGKAYGRSTAPPPPSTANAKDLFGITRLIHTYQIGSNFFLLDGSRPMFEEAVSQLPNDPVGAILTLDANNTAPGSGFNASHITSANNSWNDPTSVSAHHHTAVTYEYYRQTLNRNSVNGNGGSIISLIHVTNPDGSPMDNAFWNGAACFYGNGESAFLPLAKGLDVVAHELTHGVIQATANLVYEKESGALNESYADIFAAMVDRDDYQIGEDVVKLGAFPSGRMRDMEDPHNGGTSLADPGFQPKHVNEQFKGNADNGGVHINSGIPNHAFYLFSSNAQVGKDKAEQVFYRALTTYLVKSSVFLDLRAAVIQSCKDLFGAAPPLVAAAENAFNQVGIGSGSSGGEIPNDYQDELAVNPGDRFLLFTTDNNKGLYISQPDGSGIQKISNTSLLSRPSITDDGSAILFVDLNNQMRLISLDWKTLDFQEQVIQSQPIWQSVCVARDGSRLAAIQENGGNALSVFDFGLQAWKDFELYNPTTADGVVTGEVQYPDAFEFDHSGQYVLYDAFNFLEGQGGVDLEYWDVGLLEVWDHAMDQFADGQIFKLFSNLPENASIGNPTFAKNAPFVVAFDYLDGNTDIFFILGSNIESGDVGLIHQNSKVGYPNFAVDDQSVLFDATASFSGVSLVASVGVEPNRIIGKPSTATGLISEAHWGIAFANGERVLTDMQEQPAEQTFGLFPNPGQDQVRLSGADGDCRIEMYDILGQLVVWKEKLRSGEYFDVGDLAPGVYRVVIGSEDAVSVLPWVKAMR